VTGEPENLEPLKDDVPEGWIVTGYPYRDAKTQGHDVFMKAYQARYNDYPRLSSVMGYATIRSITEGMKKAKSEDTEKLVAAFANLQVDTPFGRIVYRANDNQSTIGSFVGKTKLVDGVGVMVDSIYRDGAQFQQSDQEVQKMSAIARTTSPEYAHGAHFQASANPQWLCRRCPFLVAADCLIRVTPSSISPTGRSL
jgi:branched-chain amino acid transport system substrate-binding protein